MRSAKSVVDAFFPPGKATQAALLAQGAHALVAAGQNFVRISLMAHIPDQSVFRGVVDIVQGDGELDGAQVRAEVTACLRNRLNQTLAQFDGQARQTFPGKLFQVRRRLDPLQQGVHVCPEDVIDRPVIYLHLTNRQVKLTLE